MKNSLTGLIGTAIISTVCLTGCSGKKEIPKKASQQPQTQQKETLRTIYTIKNKDGSVLGYFNETDRANLQGLENAGRVEDYRINPITREVYRLTDEKHEVVGLEVTDKPFAEYKKPQEPEKPVKPEYITREQMEKIIEEKLRDYHSEQQPQQTPYNQPTLAPPQHHQQSNDMIPIKPPQKPRVSVDVEIDMKKNQVDIMDLPPSHPHRR